MSKFHTDVFDIIAKGKPKDREHLIGPWFQAGDLLMLYAPRGVGKTRVSIKLAHTLASGSEFASWKVPRPMKVAYFDGEMGQEQMARIFSDTDETSPSGVLAGHLFAFCYDNLPNSLMPNLSQPEGQAAYDYMSKGCEVIFIDNLLSCSEPSGRNDDDVAQWGRILQWLLKKRAEGVTVVVVHHAGKSGDQLGTSVRENALDTVVQLKPSRCAKEDEYGVEWHFTKSRNFFGQDTDPLHVTLNSNNDGIQNWKAEKLWNAKSRVFWDYVERYGKAVAKEYLNLQGWEIAKMEYEANDLGQVVQDAANFYNDDF